MGGQVRVQEQRNKFPAAERTCERRGTVKVRVGAGSTFLEKADTLAGLLGDR